MSAHFVLPRRWLALLLLAAACRPALSADPVPPLPRAHSHNDYQQKRPLLDALQQGFCSVEADVWLVDGQLLVAHDLDQVKSGRTLESLYLMPLHERVHANGGRVFRDGPVFTLLIDFKSEAEPTYAALKQALADHANMLTRFTPEGIHTNAVTVIVSGNRPINLMTGEADRLAAADGRFSDLENLPPVHVMPLISDNWSAHLQWKGEGDFPENEAAQLRDLVTRAQAAGRRIRLWAAPDAHSGWLAQWDAGVDLINTDKLPDLAAWMRSK